MWLRCPDCGFQDDIHGSRSYCPKCGTGILEQTEPPDKSRQKEKAEISDSGNYTSGKEEVGRYVGEGKGLGVIINLMKGKLASTTVRSYFYYAMEKRKKKAAGLPNETNHPEPSGDFVAIPFMIYQKDLRFLSDVDFDEIWQAIGKIIRIMARQRI